MTSLSTEEFPYTTGYVTQLLSVDETELMEFVRALSLSPQTDERTGNLIFSHTDTETLRKAIDMNRRGEDLTTIAKYFNSQQQMEKDTTVSAMAFGNRMTQPQSAGGTSLRTGGKENLALVVEAVSNAKEGILKDMGRLLDDKLAGLDEVVVELIRCKSENDALKQKAKLLTSEKEALQDELARFKSAGFGFYRKLD